MLRRLLAALVVVGVLMPAFVPSTKAPTHVGRFRSPGPADIHGLVAAGVPFEMADLLALYPNARLIVEAAFGANLTADPSGWDWTDITTDVRLADRQRINISPMGRSNESGSAQPAGCTFQLDNTSGDYTAYNAASQYHPYVRRNTPIRCTVNLTGDDADDSIRFQGYANGWKPSWDESANLAVVTVSASGALRRLRQGKTVKSPWRRYIEASDVQPIAWWPVEDGSNATSAASAIVGAPAMVVSGGSSAASGVRFASGTTRSQAASTGYHVIAPATPPLASLSEGGSLAGAIPASSRSPVAWTVQFVARLWAYTGFAGSDIVLARWYTPGGTYDWWEVRMLSVDGGFELVGSDGTVVISPATSTVDLSQFRITATQSGSNIETTFRVSGVGSNGEGGSFDTDSRAGTLARPRTFYANPDYATLANEPIGGSENQTNDIVIGQIQVYDTITGVPSLTSAPAGDAVSPWTGWLGETATARLDRLFGEEGVPLEIFGTSETTMGPQDTGTFLGLVAECEETDRGLLFDGRGPGCGYVARSAAFNQAATLTVNAATGQIPAGTFQPDDSDQRNRNLVVAANKGGISVPYEDASGPLGTKEIGVYDDTINVNLDDDAAVVQHAAWEVHLGTVEGFRYPTLALDLVGTSPELAADWAALRLLGRADVTNVTSRATQHPPGTVSLVAEGWAEQLSPFVWRAVANCSPYAPWSVGELDMSGFLDCGASAVLEDVDTTELGIDVLVADECVWDHGDGDFVIVIDDEEMTVTAVSAAAGSYPARTQTLTVTRSVNGVVQEHRIGAPVHVRDGFVLAL